MSESKFKVGDRVAVYSGGERYLGRITSTSKASSGVYAVEAYPPNGSNFYIEAHWKQIRRLKKRERRRVWLSKQHTESLTDGTIRTQSPRLVPPEPGAEDAFIEFVEVCRKVKP
jgi:hypothetical protein